MHNSVVDCWVAHKHRVSLKSSVKTVRFRLSNNFARALTMHINTAKTNAFLFFISVRCDVLTLEQFSCQFGCGGAYPLVPLQIRHLEFYSSKMFPWSQVKQTAILRGKVNEGLVAWCCPILWCWRTRRKSQRHEQLRLPWASRDVTRSTDRHSQCQLKVDPPRTQHLHHWDPRHWAPSLLNAFYMLCICLFLFFCFSFN